MPRSQRPSGLELVGKSAKDRRAFERSGLACRPNLAGWPRPARLPYYLGSTTGRDRNNPSMLLSFERPASAGSREDAPLNGVTDHRGEQSTLYASSRSLKTAQKPHQPPSISGG